MINTQVFFSQRDDDLLLVIDELFEVAVMVLAKVLGVHACQLILALDVVDADLALFHQFLREKISQRDVLARTVGAVTGDVQRRRVVDILRHADEAPSNLSCNVLLDQGTASSILRAVATSSDFIVDCAVSPCSSTLKLIGALACITMHDNVDLPLSRLLPQLAPEKAVSRKPPCL